MRGFEKHREKGKQRKIAKRKERSRKTKKRDLEKEDSWEIVEIGLEEEGCN